jgi:hypothetical protein
MNLGLIIIVELILVALLADFPFTCIQRSVASWRHSSLCPVDSKKELSRLPLFFTLGCFKGFMMVILDDFTA